MGHTELSFFLLHINGILFLYKNKINTFNQNENTFLVLQDKIPISIIYISIIYEMCSIYNMGAYMGEKGWNFKFFVIRLNMKIIIKRLENGFEKN